MVHRSELCHNLWCR